MPSPPAVWLKVCTTCDRQAPREPDVPSLGERLADRIAVELRGSSDADLIALRRVPCLSGCKHPGNIALGAAGWTKIRLNSAALALSPMIAALAVRYALSGDGALGIDDVPEELRTNLAAIIPPQ